MVGYLYLLTNRFELYRRMIRRQFDQMDFPIGGAKDAADATEALAAKGLLADGVREILAAKIARMAAIETIDQNFVRPEYVTQLQPAESYERVYVLKATRRFASVASYMVAFDTKLRWSESAEGASTARVSEQNHKPIDIL